MVPTVPFSNTLVPAAFAETVFNDFVDGREIPLDSFFEHDKSTFPLGHEKIGKPFSATMIHETLKALQSAKRITVD